MTLVEIQLSCLGYWQEQTYLFAVMYVAKSNAAFVMVSTAMKRYCKYRFDDKDGLWSKTCH